MAAWIKSGSFTGSIDNFIAIESGDSFEKDVKRCIKAWQAQQSVFTFQTSGSTGVPKSISFRREQLRTSAHLTLAALGLQAGQTALVCLDVNLIAGFMMVIRSLEGKMNIILKSPTSNPLQDLHEQIDFMAVVPYQLNTLLSHEKEKVNQIKKVIVGGAPLSTSVMAELQDLKPEFYATYGMTETITHVALQKVNGPGRSDQFQFLPQVSGSVDERGCLTILAPHLDHPVVTHDVVEFSDHHHFKWLGRIDDVINSGGIKIHPGQLELKLSAALTEIGMGRRFVVTGLSDPKLGTAVALVLEGEPYDPSIEARIREVFQKVLTRLEHPKSIHFLKRFPETASQKIDRLKISTLIRS